MCIFLDETRKNSYTHTEKGNNVQPKVWKEPIHIQKKP